MDKKYEIFPIIEGLYMTWFTVEFVFRFLSSPSKVSIKNTIIKLTIFKICFKDSIHEEVDERDRLYCRDALLYQPNFLQVSFLYKFRNKQAQAFYPKLHLYQARVWTWRWSLFQFLLLFLSIEVCLHLEVIIKECQNFSVETQPMRGLSLERT